MRDISCIKTSAPTSLQKNPKPPPPLGHGHTYASAGKWGSHAEANHASSLAEMWEVQDEMLARESVLWSAASPLWSSLSVGSTQVAPATMVDYEYYSLWHNHTDIVVVGWSCVALQVKVHQSIISRKSHARTEWEWTGGKSFLSPSTNGNAAFSSHDAEPYKTGREIVKLKERSLSQWQIIT